MNWKTRLRHYYGDYRLTISGEILFAPRQAVRYTWPEELRKKRNLAGLAAAAVSIFENFDERRHSGM